MPGSEAAAAAIPRVAASDPRRWLAMGMLALVQFMFALDSTIVNPALPTIQRDLHFSASGLAWVVNGYTLVAGGFLILGGRVADIVGRRRMFIIGTIIFAIASTCSGLAQSSGMLVASRFAQGFGEAMASPAALALVVLLFTDHGERAKAIGAWGGISGLGATLGCVFSGVLVDEVSWRWIFLVNIPVAAVVVFIVPRLTKESRLEHGRKLDITGAVLVTAGLTVAVDGLLSAAKHGWGSSNVLVPLGVGLALLIAFAVSQLSQRDPLIPKRFFRNRTRVSANLATMFAGAGFFGMFFTVTLYMQDVLHYSPLQTGLAWGAFGLMLFVGLGVSLQLLPKIGIKPALIASYLISAAGLFLLSKIPAHRDFLSHLLPGMLIMAFGQAISFIGLLNAGLHGLGNEDAGLGSAVQYTSQQLGGSIGLAVLVTVALRHTAHQLARGAAPAVAATDGYALAVRLCAFIMLAGAVVVATLFEHVQFVPPDQAALAAAEATAGAATPGAAPATAGATATV